MPRTAVAASGIGRATRELLGQRGENVIGVDVRDAEVVTGLSGADGRNAMVEGVRRLSGGRIDSVYAVAGLAVPTPATGAVNFFGALATLGGLRPLLSGSPSPRAVLVSSMAALLQSDAELVSLLTAEDEPAALARGGEENTHLCGQIVYVDGGSDAVLCSDAI